MVTNKRRAFRTEDDPARVRYGAGRDSHPEEYAERLHQIRGWKVEIVQSGAGMNYQPSAGAGRPGRLVFDSEASISALRHEYRHVKRDVEAAFPGLRYWFENPDVTWREEFGGYMEEITFARTQRDYELGRKLVKLMRDRRKELLEGVNDENNATT